MDCQQICRKYKFNNAKIFLIFLDYNLFYLKEIEMNPKDIGIILYNYLIHKERFVRKFCTKKREKLYFLLPY